MSAYTIADIGLPVERIEVAESGCWLWTGNTNRDGYGQLPIERKRRGGMQYAHRVAYQSVNGPIPEGFHTDHLCRVRNCVNPAHLEAVTPRVNLLRGNGWSGRNARVTHCPHGHEYSPENTYHRPGGRGRVCRTCWTAKSKARNLERTTHCKHGHEFTPENTSRPGPAGMRRCKTCATEKAVA